jgi:tetratricopeptide (TPR) repeat protein
MRLLVTTILAATFLLPFSAYAEIKTITHAVKQPFGGSQSPDDARTAGIARAKREALEQFGTYIESTTIVKNAQVDSDEILALTAGVTKAEVMKQKNYTDGDGFGLEITVKVELDTAVLEKSLKRLLNDRNHLKDLKASRAREKQLLARIVELEKQNKKKSKTKEQAAKLNQEFKGISKGLAAVEWRDKADALWSNIFSFGLPDLDKSIEYLTQAIRLDPDFAGTYSKRGIDYALQNNYELAIADYDQAIRLGLSDSSVYFNRGSAFVSLNKSDQAVTNFSQAIQLDPNYVMAYVQRGLSYTVLGQYDRAIADYNYAIRLSPNSGKTYYMRGVTYSEGLFQYDKAISDYDQAIQLDRNFANAYVYRGKSYSNLKQADRAIADFNQAINLDPTLAGAFNYRGLSYLSSNQVETGCADLENACKLGDCSGYNYFRKNKLCK